MRPALFIYIQVKVIYYLSMGSDDDGFHKGFSVSNVEMRGGIIGSWIYRIVIIIEVACNPPSTV